MKIIYVNGSQDACADCGVASGVTHLKTCNGGCHRPKRINKWLKEYVVQGNYGYSHGWEDVTASETYKEAKDDLKAYRENSSGAHRLITRRVLNPEYQAPVTA